MTPDTPPRLFDQLQQSCRLKHFSPKTEKSYSYYIRDYILFHNKRHPREMGVDEIRQYLSGLAIEKHVAASTQNIALSALLFLYRDVLKLELPYIDHIERAKRPKRVPVVFTRHEASAVLAELEGESHLMASLLYGAGLRLTECLQLRVKDVDFEYRQITVRNGKGQVDRMTLLPSSLIEPLKKQLEHAQSLHHLDLSKGYGAVSLPTALERKYPHANRDWKWQFIFPSWKRSINPQSAKVGRHHVDPATLQRADELPRRRADGVSESKKSELVVSV